MVSEENFDHGLPLYYALFIDEGYGIISLVNKMLIAPTFDAKHLEGTA